MSEEKKKNKKCFIITPIGADGSEIRRKADGVINAVIKPVLKRLGFDDIKAAHEITASGSINNQIISRIVNDDMVIANLTGLNPNVMYELAIRHATQKPIVHICENTTGLPFDIKDQRTIFYNDDMFSVKELERRLEMMVKDCIGKEIKDNPIYNAVTDMIFREVAVSKTDDGFQKYLLDRFDSLDNKINSLFKNPQIYSIEGKDGLIYIRVSYNVTFKTYEGFDLLNIIEHLALAFKPNRSIILWDEIITEETSDSITVILLTVEMPEGLYAISGVRLIDYFEKINTDTFEVISVECINDNI